jgi:hypothetical protein
MVRSLGSSLCPGTSEGPVNFLCPLLAGVVVGDVREVVAQSSHPMEWLMPTPLSQPEVMNCLESRQWAPALLKSPELRRCVVDLGGVPLVVEAFVKSLEARHADYRQQPAPASVIRGAREDTKAYMVNRIMRTFRAEAANLQELLLMVLWNRENVRLSTRVGARTVEHLQAVGVLSLDEDERRIRIPLIYLVSQRSGRESAKG